MDHTRSFTDSIEETLIAVILGLMTALTFANVVARYAFASNILWALEMTVFLFAWLVLLGAAYAVKKGTHLGVDLVVNMLDRGARKVMALAAVTVCLAFAFLMMKGSWDYWANFANLPATEGRWFPTGLEERVVRALDAVAGHEAVGRVVQFDVAAVDHRVAHRLAVEGEVVQVDAFGVGVLDTAVVDAAAHDAVEGHAAMVRVLDRAIADAQPLDSRAGGALRV